MTSQELISALEAARILNISVHSLRDYRKRQLILVAAKRGNADLYDKADVIKRYKIIEDRRKQGFSLSQISLMLAKETNNVISIPGPQDPTAGMSNQELLHGFLAELYQNSNNKTKAYIKDLSRKWNVHFTEQGKK